MKKNEIATQAEANEAEVIIEATGNEEIETMQEIVTTDADKNSITLEQLAEVKDVIGRTLDVVNADQVDADIVMAHLAAISKLYRKITRPASDAPVVIREDGVKLVGATTTIICSECGKEHMVKVQDAGQVVRCPSCQKKYRNAKRAEKRKAKAAEVRATKAEEKALAERLLAEYKASRSQANA